VDSSFQSGIDSGVTSANDSGTEAGIDSGIASGIDASSVTSASVLQHHKNATRDGFYVDAALTKTAVTTMHLDTRFQATTTGKTFSQPLFMEGGVNGQDALYVATELNDVIALDPTTGAQLWTKNLGAPAPRSEFCGGSIDPLGATGTPIIDPASRSIYVAAMTNAGAAGTTPTHMIYSLSVDTGSINWSVDVSAAISGFDSSIQNQRGALALLDGKVFVPYGGLDGDCGNYKGWVIGVPVNDPTAATGWATPFTSGPGIWSPGGIASDGVSLFVTTGNTNPPYTMQWDQANSEAVIRLDAAPSFSGITADYFAPTDWYLDDREDTDMTSSGVVLFDAPGATPTHLAFCIGKASVGRLVDQTNLGGIFDGLSNLTDTSGEVFGSTFAYTTAQGTYVGMNAKFLGCVDGDFSVLKVSPTAPPALSFGWCARSGAGGNGGGPVSSSTSTNGATDSVVWSFGVAGDGILRGWDADTGASIVTTTAVAGNVQHWTSPIIAKGRVYVAGDGAVYAFTL
jgi:hypothetical protein